MRRAERDRENLGDQYRQNPALLNRRTHELQLRVYDLEILTWRAKLDLFDHKLTIR